MRFWHAVGVAVLVLGACAPLPAGKGEQPKDLTDLVGKVDNYASRQVIDEIRIGLIEEGVRVYFGLHASELLIRHYYEEHSSAYVRWVRYKDYLAANETDEVTVAGWLSKVEVTRLALHEERRKYSLMRQRLSELTGESFPDEMVNPPSPPKIKPPSFDLQKVIKAVRDADFLEYVDPTMPNIKSIAYRVQETVTGINVSWQGIVAAMAKLDHARKNLALQQQLYSQEQSTSLGAAMTVETKSEAQLVKATGEYYGYLVRLAVYLDLKPEEGLAPVFPSRLMKMGLGDTGAQFVPKEGSGFGQDDQNERK